VWKSLDIFFPSFLYPSALKIKVAGFLWQEDCYPIAGVHQFKYNLANIL
jgi:hypothetical protein